MSVGAELRAAHAARLREFVGHPFFRAAEAGTLPDPARDRYFRSERHFVGAARGVFAHLLANAPDLAAARHLVAILDGLVNAQEPLFDRIFATLGLDGTTPVGPATVALGSGMTAIAREGPYAAGIAAMGVAEWTYAEVSRRTSWHAAEDQTLRAWFELHGALAFLQGAAWLDHELDRTWSAQDAAAVEAAFRSAIDLEIAFHDEVLS